MSYMIIFALVLVWLVACQIAVWDLIYSVQNWPIIYGILYGFLITVQAATVAWILVMCGV